MRRRSVIYALCGISGEHIFAKMSRYARPTLDIRFLRHHRGAYLRSSLGLCQTGCCLRLHRRKGKVKELISSWRIVVLCAETRLDRRLCARTLQYMLCMASSMRRGVSPATPLRTGSNGLRYRFFASLRTTVYWRSLRQCRKMLG